MITTQLCLLAECVALRVVAKAAQDVVNDYERRRLCVGPPPSDSDKFEAVIYTLRDALAAIKAK